MTERRLGVAVRSSMTCQEILSHLYGRGRFGMKPGLRRIRSILKALSDPQDSLKVIHVAGTNGKGSTAAFLASVLEAGRHTVGLFTSPHLIAFPERIRINGREISEPDVVSVAERVLSAAPGGSTFFEIVTAMAYLYFAEKGVGPAVMEVGMGGRLDATNTASGVLSVITPVALDHCEYLGGNLGQIAGEKSGVIKAGSPVVVAPQSSEALTVITACAAERQSPVFIANRDFSALWGPGGLVYHGIGWQMAGLKPGIPGRYQAFNAASALCAAELLDRQGLSVKVTEAREGIEKSFWPGRMEMVPGPPRILLDGAHNPAGAEALAESLADIRREALVMVIGMVGDKDTDGVLAPLVPLADRIIAVSPSVPRGLPSQELAEKCRTLGCRAIDAGNVTRGINIALSGASLNDLVLICGSLFTVGEARALLHDKVFEPFRG